MSLFAKKEQKEELKPINPEEVPQPTETIEAELASNDENKIDPSWVGVVTPEEVASESDAVYKANTLNLLFSIYNELRTLNKQIKDE